MRRDALRGLLALLALHPAVPRGHGGNGALGTPPAKGALGGEAALGEAGSVGVFCWRTPPKINK